MTKTDFLKEMYEMLEITSVDEITEKTVLKELAEYNSLFVLTIITIVDEHFNMQLSAEQLASVTTIKSLTELIGNEKFDN